MWTTTHGWILSGFNGYWIAKWEDSSNIKFTISDKYTYYLIKVQCYNVHTKLILCKSCVVCGWILIKKVIWPWILENIKSEKKVNPNFYKNTVFLKGIYNCFRMYLLYVTFFSIHKRRISFVLILAIQLNISLCNTKLIQIVALNLFSNSIINDAVSISIRFCGSILIF